MKSGVLPDWIIAVVWFMAGICATGSFWYFLGARNQVGTIASAVATGGLAVVAIAMHIHNDRWRTRSKMIDSPTRLLSFIWSYPLAGENEASWAVKESATLKGDLGTAREKPALGVAIITTELALACFGRAADTRIDRCIAWAVARTEPEPPHQMLVEVVEPSDFQLESVKKDFRHTLAFGVILARAKKQYTYLQSYLSLALTKQNGEGGWPSESASTISPVFTAFYAVELLHLTLSDPAVPERLRANILDAQRNGISWLMNHREADGLWTSSALRDFAWDHVFATAWVLHRLAPLADVGVEGWCQCLDDALLAMVQAALAPQTWAGATESQRHRVEARVAAAVARAQHIKQLSARSLEAARLYRGAWKARVEDWLNRLPPDQMDVGTAAFLLWGMVPEERFTDIGKAVLLTEGSHSHAELESSTVNS